MSGDEEAHLAKARRMLAQANALSSEEAPESVIHRAYYAMLHAATAVLLRHRGGVALTHTGLIEAFGRFAAGWGDIGRA